MLTNLKQNLYILLVLLLSLIGTFSVSAQIVDAQGQYVDTVFNDNVDRTAEDFVTVSLMIVDPGVEFYTVLGHACLRLQCPTFALDYCYSYESEDMTNRVLDFLAGNLKMGLLAIPTSDYCAYYAEHSRGVREYKLNLPPDVETNLWRIMDERLKEGTTLSFDYFNRGCATTCVRFMNQALLGYSRIEYAPWLYEDSPTPCKLVKANTKDALWVRFYWNFLVGEDVKDPLPGDRQLIIPIDLVRAWQEATIDGKLIISDEPQILVKGEPQKADGWFTPNMATLMLLLLAIANLFWKRPYFDWLMLAIQTMLGVVLFYLIYFSNLCCASWNWMLIPFAPLPILLWHWRKYWALPYAGALVIWSIYMVVLPLWEERIIDLSHVMLILAWILVIIKQSNISSRFVETI